jgi:iron complex outermembrane receptor protein
MKRAFVFLLSTIIFQHVSAQIEITGKVINRSSEQPIGDVEVVLSNASAFVQKVNTAPNGTFKFEGVERGAYFLSTEHVSYEGETKPLDLTEDVSVIFKIADKIELQEEVIVSAVRARSNETPVTLSNINKAQIDASNFGQDLPFILNQSPGVLVHSDAGAGVGYTGMRIRGVDPTRINVTINGIPLNDAESHGVYWVDLPDIASSINSIQIQRGVGTSTNGAAAFGASVNIKTDHINRRPFSKLTVGGGSFGTKRYTMAFGSGLIQGKWGIQGSLSQIQSEGFIDRASSYLSSINLSAGYYAYNSVLKFVVLKGHERTYQAWYGVPQAKFNQNEAGLNAFIDELGIDGTYESNLRQSEHNKYNYYTYDNEVDNYDQTHYQVLFNKRLGKAMNWQSAGHYTRGLGYYEQFQNKENGLDQTDFAFYGLRPISIGDSTINRANFIRRRWLDNHFYGIQTALNGNSGSGTWNLGAALQQYEGEHYGELIWAEYASNSEIGDRYYQNDAQKLEANVFAKYLLNLNRKFAAFGDLQYRFIHYEFVGPNSIGNPTDREESFHFINPKVGLNFIINARSRMYGAFAISNREPVRDDYVQSSSGSKPDHETLKDIELGYSMEWRKAYYKANVYFMEYVNQLVLTGKINDVGAATRENVAKSYRRGVELEAGWNIFRKVEIAGNLSVSVNKIKSYTEYLDDWVNGNQVMIPHVQTNLAFSPGHIAFVSVSNEWVKNFTTTLVWKSVGAQYLDNTQSDDRKLEGYNLINFVTSYPFKLKASSWEVGVQINNLFNIDYAPNGYTFGAQIGEERKSYNYVYPQAGRHFMFKLSAEIL